MIVKRSDKNETLFVKEKRTLVRYDATRWRGTVAGRARRTRTGLSSVGYLFNNSNARDDNLRKDNDYMDIIRRERLCVYEKGGGEGRG
jgi:hypothetical protein